MPWKETTTMEQKIEFICEWRTGKYTITELCKNFELAFMFRVFYTDQARSPLPTLKYLAKTLSDRRSYLPIFCWGMQKYSFVGIKQKFDVSL